MGVKRRAGLSARYFMAAGITVYNDSNTIQVDGDYRNMLLVASGQFTANNQTSAQDLWYGQLLNIWRRLTPAGMLAVRCVSGFGINTTIGSYRGSIKICNFGYKRNTNTSFQYYIFDNVNPISLSTSGLQVFNDLGELVYDAYDYPLKIVSVLDLGDPPNTNTVVYTGPHSNLANACLSGGNEFSDDGQDGEEWTTWTLWSGQSLIARQDFNDQAGGGGQGIGTWGLRQQSAIIVDTTNLPLNYDRGG